MKVLIVDDHAVVRSGLRRLLQEAADIELIEAADSAQALAAFEMQRPDVVVIDINLPGLGGLELLRRQIAQELALSGIPGTPGEAAPSLTAREIDLLRLLGEGSPSPRWPMRSASATRRWRTP